MRLLLFLFLILWTTKFYGQEKGICISIDDVPAVTYGSKDKNLAKEITTKLLATCEEFGIPAIAFVNERKLYKRGRLEEDKVQLLEMWLSSGCDLGNHTYSHLDYNKVKDSTYFEDILRGERHHLPLLKKYGHQVKYFRHPYLHLGPDSTRSDKLQAFLEEESYVVSPVTIDNADYLFAKAYHDALAAADDAASKKIGATYIDYMEQKLKYFEKKSMEVFGRNIDHTLLIHASLLNANYLDDLAEMYVKNGYRFISQKEVLRQREYMTEVKTYTKRGISWIFRWALSMGMSEDIMEGDVEVPPEILNGS